MSTLAVAQRAIPKLRPGLGIGAIALGLVVAVGAPVTPVSASLRLVPAHPRDAATASAPRSPRPDTADWEKIKTAASLRRLALAPHRSDRFRAFAASLALSELVSLHRLAPGVCTTAVTYLYDNLLDLENAYPGENWAPLRRAVAHEPSIHACAPRPTKRQA